MKPNHLFWLLLCASTLHAQTAVHSVSSLPSSTIVGYQIGEQGPSHRTWQKILKINLGVGDRGIYVADTGNPRHNRNVRANLEIP